MVSNLYCANDSVYALIWHSSRARLYTLTYKSFHLTNGDEIKCSAFLFYSQVDDSLRRILESLMTYIVHVNHVKLNELFLAGNNPEMTIWRLETVEREVAKLEANVLMLIACSISEIARSRGVRVDASAIQRLQRIRYAAPPSLTLGDMEAFVILNTMQRDFLAYSSMFFGALHNADVKL